MVCVLRNSLLVAAVAMLLLVSSTYAQWQKVGPQDFESTALPEKQGCVVSYTSGIVWAGGHSLYRSDDLGISWQAVPTFPLSSSPILGIYFFDRNNGYVLTRGATIFVWLHLFYIEWRNFLETSSGEFKALGSLRIFC